MPAPSPIAASEATAARLLDMGVAEFRELVVAGVLPRGREIAPGLRRWDVAELRKIITGHAAEGMDDVTWPSR
jgi:hypothetical protein